MPKIFTTAILLASMGIALCVSGSGSPVYALIMAQAWSVFAVPLIAVGLLLVFNNKEVMGIYKNALFPNILAFVGFILCAVS